LTTTVVDTEQQTKHVTEEELVKQARRKELIQAWFWRIMGYVVVLGLWEYASGRVLEEALLPGPMRVLDTLWKLAYPVSFDTGLGAWERDAVMGTFIPTGIVFAIGGTGLLYYLATRAPARVARWVGLGLIVAAAASWFLGQNAIFRWMLVTLGAFSLGAPTKERREGWALIKFLLVYVAAVAFIVLVAVAGSGKIPSAFQATIYRIAIGFSISFFIGAAIGVLTQNRWAEGFFKDSVVVSLTAPGLIWALIAAIIFGNRAIGPWIAIILTTFALVTVNVSEGVRSLPKDLLDMGRAFKVSRLDMQRHVVIPHLAPFLFTGLRFGFSIAWKVTVLTEVFSSSEGIGFEMRTSSQIFRVDEFLTWILAFFFFALFLEKVVLQAFERRFFRWRQAVTAS
jgi:NitT/TauT family transport system permease protein